MTLIGGERAGAFLDWADEQSDGMEAVYKPFEEGGKPQITSIWYQDRPDPGWGVGLTYGASLLPDSNVELLIVVRSRDPAWIWALAHLADSRRADIGTMKVDDTVNWNEPVARHCRMDAFFIGPPSNLESGEDIVHLGADDHVRILQAYPIYASERALVREIGGRAFTQRLGDQLDNLRRPPIA